MTSFYRTALVLMVLGVWIPAAPAQDVELEHAIRAMDAGNAEDAIKAGAHVSAADFEFLAQVARQRAANDPEGVRWRHEMYKVFQVLIDAHFPSEPVFMDVQAVLRFDDPRLAAMRAQDALEAYFLRGDPNRSTFRNAMKDGADPLAKPYKGDWPDLYAVLIDVVQQRLARDAVDPIDPYYTPQLLRQDADEAYAMMAEKTTPPMAARAYLDAALTPYGETIDFTWLDRSAEARQIQLSVGKYRAINEGADGAPISWAEGYKHYLSRTEE